MLEADFPYGGLELRCLDKLRRTESSIDFRAVLLSTPVQVVIAILIAYAVLINDLRVLVLPPDSDFTVGIVTVVVAVVFLVESTALSVFEPGYFASFYWFCDVLSAITLLFDVHFVALARYARLARFLRVTRISLRVRAHVAVRLASGCYIAPSYFSENETYLTDFTCLQLLRATRAGFCAGRAGRTLSGTDEKSKVPGVTLLARKQQVLPPSSPTSKTSLQSHWTGTESGGASAQADAQADEAMPSATSDAQGDGTPSGFTPGNLRTSSVSLGKAGETPTWVINRRRLMLSSSDVTDAQDGHSSDSDEEYFDSRAAEFGDFHPPARKRAPVTVVPVGPGGAASPKASEYTTANPTAGQPAAGGGSSASIAPAAVSPAQGKKNKTGKLTLTRMKSNVKAATFASRVEAKSQVRRSVLGATLIHRTSLIIVIGLVITVLGTSLLSPTVYPNNTAESGLLGLVQTAAVVSPAEQRAAAQMSRDGVAPPTSAQQVGGDMAKFLHWRVATFMQSLAREDKNEPKAVYLQLNGSVFVKDADGISARRRDQTLNLVAGDVDLGPSERYSAPFELVREVAKVDGAPGVVMSPPGTFNRCGIFDSCVIVDVRSLVRDEAGLSLGQSLLAVLLLLGWGIVFSINYHLLVVTPIERMVSRLRLLASNPMLAVSLIDPRQDHTGTVYFGADRPKSSGKVDNDANGVLGGWQGGIDDTQPLANSDRKGSKPAMLPDAPPTLDLVTVSDGDSLKQWYGDSPEGRSRAPGLGSRQGSFYGGRSTPPVTSKKALANALSSRNLVAGIRNGLRQQVQDQRTSGAQRLSERKQRRNPSQAGKFLETHIVEASLSRFGRLLQVVAGEAGAGVISRSLRGGKFDPVVPGVKVSAVFGFCDIRNFTNLCEVFREETMEFTNNVSNVVHKISHDCGGAINKNIGDAFLVVWKPASGMFGHPSAATNELLHKAAQLMDGDDPKEERDTRIVQASHSRQVRFGGGEEGAAKADGAPRASVSSAERKGRPPLARLQLKRDSSEQAAEADGAGGVSPADKARAEREGAWTQCIALGQGGMATGIGDPLFDVASLAVASARDDAPSPAKGGAALKAAPKPRRQRTWKPTVADAALQAAIDTMYSLAQNNTVQDFARRPGVQKRLPGYRVRLGYGLHYGWAIEGAIGTAYKIDASYLSPHVNMAARLEEATKQFGVPILMSAPFVCLLSKPSEHPLTAYVRPVDVVRVKGSAAPIALFTFDFFDAIADGMLPWISPTEATFLSAAGIPSPSFMPTLDNFLVKDKPQQRFSFHATPLRRKERVSRGRERAASRGSFDGGLNVSAASLEAISPPSTPGDALSGGAEVDGRPASSAGEDVALLLSGSPFRLVWCVAMRWYVEGHWEAAARALLICKAMRPADGPTRVLLGYMHRHGVRLHVEVDTGKLAAVPMARSQTPLPVVEEVETAPTGGEAAALAGKDEEGTLWVGFTDEHATEHLEELMDDLAPEARSVILRSAHWQRLPKKHASWVPGLHCPDDWQGHRGLMEK